MVHEESAGHQREKFGRRGFATIRTSALEVGLFANMAVPGVIEFTGQSDKTVEIGGFGGNGVYWHGGLEATMYFGDFTPPKNAKKGKKGGKNKKGKNGRR